MKDVTQLPDVVVRFILQYIDYFISKIDTTKSRVNTATQQVLGRIDNGDFLPECVVAMIDENRGNLTRLQYLYAKHPVFCDAHGTNAPDYINIESLVGDDGFYNM